MSRSRSLPLAAAAAIALCACSNGGGPPSDTTIQVGVRPLYLVRGMDEGPLNDVSCRAGLLVCRHSECDLDATTDIVATALNQKCTVPWTGPVGPGHPAPQCCTSDLTLAEFRTLQAKMESSDPAATTPEGYLGGTPDWRTDLYTGRARVMTFRFDVDDILYWIRRAPAFGRQAVHLDSIDPTVAPPIERLTTARLLELRSAGVRILAPPHFALLDVTADGRIVPSTHARDIRSAGLEIIAWTLERSDLRQGASKAGWYYLYDPEGRAVRRDSDVYVVLDVLAQEVGIVGIFSDWPATVTYYASCMGLRQAGERAGLRGSSSPTTAPPPSRFRT